MRPQDQPNPANCLEVRRTELGYVTAVNKEDRTFFTQLCKFTNSELVNFNLEIHNHCKKVEDYGLIKTLNPRSVLVGEIYCARFEEDGNWYRVRISEVLDSRPLVGRCRAMFVDYGNTIELGLGGLIRVEPEELGAIRRAPFGFTCSLKDSERLGDAEAQIMLEAVQNEYLMIRTIERTGAQHWRVDVPKVAYNSAFWINYHLGRSRYRNVKSEVEQQLLSRDEMIAAGLDA